MKSLLFVLALLASGLFFTVNSQSVGAVSASSFQPGRIIDDAVFYNKNAMGSAQAVQDFIASHTPACDTWGTQPSEYGGGTRAQYAASRGWPGPPYACLQNYHENPTTGETSFERGGGAFSGGQNAGRIIWDAAQAYGINPQVLLVMLKKESPGPLFADSWPLKSQYRYAMGYGCPDSGPNYSAACVDSKAGFYKQINLAAWQLRYYADHITDYNYQPGRWNYIQYNPDPACGGQNVYIDNMATASLYIYTPYVPNQGALNAYPGTASCGAYGNRNFYMFFNEWFGSTFGSVNIVSPLTISSDFKQGLFTKKNITARFTIKNNTSQRQDIGTMAIAVRDANNVNFDFGSKNIVLDPWQEYRYEASRTLNTEGRYTFSIVNYREANGWSSNYPDTVGGYARAVDNAIVQNMPTVTVQPAFDNANLHVGQSTNVRMTIRNNSSTYPVNLGYFGLAMSSPSGKNVDLPFDTVGALAPGATYNYSKQFIPKESGTYNARVSSTGDNGATWSEIHYPEAEGATTNRVSVAAKTNPTLTQGMTITQASQYAGDMVTGSFKVKNFSDTSVTVNKSLCYIIRGGPAGSNNDLGCLDINTLAPGQELTYTGSRVITAPGQYRGFFSMYDGSWHDGWSFERETGIEPTTVNFTVKSNPVLTQGLTIDNPNPRVGDTITGTFKVKNNSTSSVTVNKSLCYIIRGGPAGSNNDLGCLDINTLAPGQELTYTGSRVITAPGQYRGFFSMYDGSWHDGWSFERETGIEPTTVNFTVS
ncbi:hypothetical protein D3C86_141980 [compost metagenome]